MKIFDYLSVVTCRVAISKSGNLLCWWINVGFRCPLVKVWLCKKWRLQKTVKIVSEFILFLSQWYLNRSNWYKYHHKNNILLKSPIHNKYKYSDVLVKRFKFSFLLLAVWSRLFSNLSNLSMKVFVSCQLSYGGKSRHWKILMLPPLSLFIAKISILY